MNALTRALKPALRSYWLLTSVLALAPLAAHAQGADSARAAIKTLIRSSSPVLAARRAAVDAAQARRNAAGLASPASLSADVEEVPSFANVAGAQSMRVDVARELLPRGKRAAERTIADAEVERTRLELEIAERTFDVQIDQLVIRAAGSAAIAERLASEDSLLRGAEDALRARFAAADARYVDVLRLRTERLRVETEQRRGLADYHIARRQLARLAPASDTGTILAMADAAISQEIARLGTAAVPPLPPLDSSSAASTVRRLSAVSIRRAEASRQLALAESRSVIAPSLGVQRFNEDSRGSAIGLTAGVSLSLPFTVRGASRARLAVADREVAFAQAQSASSEASLTAALGVAADRYAVAQALLASYDATLLRGAREEREAALAAYRSGGVSLLELIDFERALAQTEVSRIRSRLEAADALTQFHLAALGAADLGGAR